MARPAPPPPRATDDQLDEIAQVLIDAAKRPEVAGAIESATAKAAS